MSDSGDAALSLIEALIEHLEAEGVLTRASIGAIYDDALHRVQAQAEAPGEISKLRALLGPLQRQ